MTFLVMGVLIWAAVHLMPSAAPGIKQSLVDKLGFNGYRGIFSLLVLTAIGLMILGWRSAQPVLVYLPIEGLRSMSLSVMTLAFLFLAASGRPSRFARIARHPQLTGLLLWTIAHLMVNGDSRSLTLFGGLGLWSVVEMIMLNRREGPWQKPEAPPLMKDLIGMAVAVAVMMLFIFVHPWIAGVPAVTG
jgi:uncharacterized membrane protein